MQRKRLGHQKYEQQGEKSIIDQTKDVRVTRQAEIGCGHFFVKVNMEEFLK